MNLKIWFFFSLWLQTTRISPFAIGYTKIQEGNGESR